MINKKFTRKRVSEVALEKPSYRDNLERIKAHYPDKEMLKVKDVQRFCGLNRATVEKLFDFKGGYISVAKLAREMS